VNNAESLRPAKFTEPPDWFSRFSLSNFLGH